MKKLITLAIGLVIINNIQAQEPKKVVHKKWQVEAALQFNKPKLSNNIENFYPEKVNVTNVTTSTMTSFRFAITNAPNNIFGHKLQTNTIMMGGDQAFTIAKGNTNFSSFQVGSVHNSLPIWQISYQLRVNVLNFKNAYIHKTRVDPNNRKLNFYLSVGAGVAFKTQSFDNLLAKTGSMGTQTFTDASGKVGVVKQEFYDQGSTNYYFPVEGMLTYRLTKHFNVTAGYFLQLGINNPKWSLYSRGTTYVYDGKFIGSTSTAGPGLLNGAFFGLQYNFNFKK